MTQNSGESRAIPLFHQRFNIEVDVDEARKRFVNRISNKVYQDLHSLISFVNVSHYKTAMYNVATKLGVEHDCGVFDEYVRGDFQKCLIALEAVHEVFSKVNPNEAETLNRIITYTISISETELGIQWHDGAFWPSGAKLMDEALVNENLKWLSDKGYQGVVIPFEKGLRHFLEAQERPERLSDTITDVYEALEALARIITKKHHKDLSQIQELFISQLKLGSYYQKMFRDYIEYACQYRHAVKPGEKRATPSPNEVEAFIYMTGLFIRLAIQQLKG